MAEEAKQEKGDSSKVISTLFKVVLGLAFLVLAVYLLMGRMWWKHTWLVIKGCAAPFLLLAGMITLAIARE